MKNRETISVEKSYVYSAVAEFKRAAHWKFFFSHYQITKLSGFPSAIKTSTSKFQFDLAFQPDSYLASAKYSQFLARMKSWISLLSRGNHEALSMHLSF